jgi:tetratricopeptide (TPR) repeat protein
VSLFGQGQAHYLARKTKAAQKALLNFLEICAGDPAAKELAPQALTYLGAMALDRKRYPEAAGHFRRVIAEFPEQSKEASYNLSLVAMIQGDMLIKGKRKDYAKAAEFYEEAVKTDPANAAALRSAGLVRYQLGLRSEEAQTAAAHFRAAEAHFIAAIGLEPADFQSRYTLGLTQYNLEKFDAMVESYSESVKLDPKHPGARFNLALALYRNRQFEESTNHAEAAKKLAPDDRQAAQLLVNIYDAWKEHLLNSGTEAYTADRILDAISHWRRLLAIDPHNPEATRRVETAETERMRRITAHTAEGDKAYEEGSVAAALAEWQAAAALDPDSQDLKEKLKRIGVARQADSMRKRAESALKLGDYHTALALVEEALRLYPKSTTANRLRVQILEGRAKSFREAVSRAKAAFVSGDLLAARRGFEMARQLNPADSEVANFMQKVAKRIADSTERLMADGIGASRSGDRERARSAFEKVLSYDPDNEDAAKQIKKLTGKESSAKISASQFRELYKRGLNAYLSNDLLQAEKAWAAALKIDPNNREVENYLHRARLKLKKSSSQPAKNGV